MSLSLGGTAVQRKGLHNVCGESAAVRHERGARLITITATVMLDSAPAPCAMYGPDSSYDGGDWGDWRNQPVSGPNQYGVSNCTATTTPVCIVAIVCSITFTRRNKR